MRRHRLAGLTCQMNSLPDSAARYLRLLDIRSMPSGLPGLQEIVLKHLCRVSFENISKLLLFDSEGRGRVTTLDEFLDGLEYRDLGGTCYTANPFLAWLLRELGYEADLLGADMDNPNVHTCIRVRIEGVSYHVDVGYAAPFRSLIRLDRLPRVITEGDLQYVLDHCTKTGTLEMKVMSGGERRHGYRVNEAPRTAEFFREIVLDSYSPGRTFMTQLRITRFYKDHSVDLRDRRMIVSGKDRSRSTVLEDMNQLKRAVASEFAMPRCPIEKAVEILERLTMRPFFGV